MEELAYVSLPSDDTGIVLDVSTGGLGFQSATPVETGQPIRFRFPVPPVKAIEVVGEVVWRDETGKSGGMRFTQLPNEVRDQILVWLGRPAVNFPVADFGGQTSDITLTPGRNGDFSSRETNQFGSRNSETPPLLSPVGPYSIFSNQTDPAAETSAAPSQLAVSSKHSLATLVVTIILAAVVGIGILIYVYARAVGESPIHLVEKIWSEIHPNSSMPAPPPPPSPPPDISQ